jgi:hypothetical protein
MMAKEYVSFTVRLIDPEGVDEERLYEYVENMVMEIPKDIVAYMPHGWEVNIQRGEYV